VRRVAAVSALALAFAAPAVAAVTWRTIADGPATGAPVQQTTAYVAFTRASTAKFSARLPAASGTLVGKFDFSHAALVVILGEFGCEDGRVVVSSIAQHGTTLAVKLVVRPLAAGTAECMAVYATYRLLSVPRSALHEPLPTRATVTLAGA
jgi:hypothetical protein